MVLVVEWKNNKQKLKTMTYVGKSAHMKALIVQLVRLHCVAEKQMHVASFFSIVL